MEKEFEGYFHFVLLNQLEALDAVRDAYENGASRNAREKEKEGHRCEYRHQLDEFVKYRETKKRKEIMTCLERLEAGTFGLCLACGDIIDIEILLASPTTNLCCRCKSTLGDQNNIQEYLSNQIFQEEERC